MKTKFHIARISAFFLLGGALAPLPLALAQPAVSPPATNSLAPAEPISVTSTSNGIWMQLNLKDAELVSTLGDIATLGNLEILTRGEIVGDATLNTKGTPETVLLALCKSNLLSCRKIDGVWVVEESAAVAKAPSVSPANHADLSFRDMEAREIVQMISQTFGLNAQVAPEVKTKIAVIRLSSRSPRQALEQIALAANLELVEKDNQILLSPRKPGEK